MEGCLLLETLGMGRARQRACILRRCGHYTIALIQLGLGILETLLKVGYLVFQRVLVQRW